jgi:septum formation protein
LRAIRRLNTGPVPAPVPDLVLGSASPRRRQLLRELGLSFRVQVADVDESLLGWEAPEAYLARVVRLKQRAVVALAGEATAVLVADTVVVLDGDILGKPADVAEARALVARLQGRTHTVLTRYAIGVAPALDVEAVARTVQTEVTMRAATPAEIARYAATGEGLDKAGAYAAQGIGAFLIQSIQGSYANVVGLPVCELVVDLAALGLLGAFP